jgi:ribosomal protein S18 acetylase RimI-like enzyme
MKTMSNLKIRIRSAAITDLEALTGLLGELFEIEEDFSPDAELQRTGLQQLMQEPGAIILVAETGEEIAGMCTVQTVISTAEGGPAGILEDLIIQSKYRKQGIGRALVATAEKWAGERKLKRIQLLMESENEDALAFYFKMGWQGTRLICKRKKLIRD